MAEAMIKLEGVGKRYGEQPAVIDLDLAVEEGKLLVLIGPSGCGKTTTLKMINRLIQPSTGAIYIGGQDTATLNPQELRRGIGYVIQSIGLFPHMTVRQNIQVVPDLLGWPKQKSAARADELLGLIGLEPTRYRDAYPRQLSGGQAQRVGDEPFGAVDPLTRERLQDEFLKLQSQLRKTVVMVTHDIDEAIKLGDLVAVMNAGRLEQVAPPEEILSEPSSKFVRQFVGADRALKRLSRIRVAELMEELPTLEAGASSAEAEALLQRHRTVYITEEGKLAGWLDRKAFSHEADVREAFTQVSAAELGLHKEDDVREALSRMLGQGVSELPVIDEMGAPVGRLGLRTIVALTADEGESQPA